jgi:hypothetical protein
MAAPVDLPHGPAVPAVERLKTQAVIRPDAVHH